jgi:hypothetical protein
VLSQLAASFISPVKPSPSLKHVPAFFPILPCAVFSRLVCQDILVDVISLNNLQIIPKENLSPCKEKLHQVEMSVVASQDRIMLDCNTVSLFCSLGINKYES